MDGIIVKKKKHQKCVNLMLPESAEVDRRHQPSAEDRDARRLTTTLAKSAKQR